ncbi:MAG TPA: AMP-binding protein [Bryobacteraceae bacterium]|nr:AMP-binding protein [Bryobacteraceae bacterium]
MLTQSGPFDDSVGGLLRHAADRDPNAIAIMAPGREPLTYGALLNHAVRIGGALRSRGVLAKDRVAIAVPNGPDMASGFLAIAAVAGCAPLNPAYRRAEFEFYLSDLRAAALVLSEGDDGEAAAAARSLGIPILRAVSGASAGEFTLAGTTSHEMIEPDWAESGDRALLLHTSGTTARPKLVPLTGKNLAASARNIAATLALTTSDRCLNIMPLFHIHGLMAAVLASMKAGASVVCADGLYGRDFFNWMRTFRPTWYTAVPTMHQALIGQAAKHLSLLRDSPLRLVRSSSAALAPELLNRLEDTFEAPVIEAYGMTEAAHQMASNPLPPGARKAGSVGRAAGPEIAIMDEAGQLLGPGAIGEVVIRGENVMAGYEANDAANASAFAAGWFRTGDQGILDGDGYLRLTGRLKELINRGGEKIAPGEIDQVLLANPNVKHAVTFAIPHRQLGEEVGAAVELFPGSRIEANALREWAGTRLVHHKVPRIIVEVDEIPKGPTGKLQRIGLAQRFNIAPIDDAVKKAVRTAPRTSLEQRIATIWREILGRNDIGVTDRFEALGGDSLLAVRMLTAVSAAEGVDLPYLRFLTDGTIESLAEEIERASTSPPSLLVPIQRAGRRPPLIWFPGHDGLMNSAVSLSRALGEDQPVWAVDTARISGVPTLQKMAAICGTALLDKPELGPWRLAGQCFGGFLAFETAMFLEQAGAAVDRLMLIDAINPAWSKEQKWMVVAAARWRAYRLRAAYHMRMLRLGNAGGSLSYFRSRVAAFLRGRSEDLVPRGARGERRSIAKIWKPRRWAGQVLLVREPGRRPEAPALGWSEVVADVREEVVPFYQTGPFASERVTILKEIVERYLNATGR